MKKKNEATFMVGEKEIKDFFRTQMETDVWQRCYTNELIVKGIDNNPIMMEVVKTDLALEHVPDEALRDCMENQKLAVGFPTETKMVYYPLRNTGFSSLSTRAGISGKTLSATEDKRSQKEMCPETKANILQECLLCYSNKSLVLIRDGAVSAVLSGDVNDYQIMPTSELIEILEESLGEVVSYYEIVNATCDYEISKVLYEITDEDMVREIVDVFRFYTKGNSCRIYVQLVTSDVGVCGANLLPIIEFEEGKQILLGKGLDTKHKWQNAMENFRLHTKQLYANFIENARRIAELKKIRIKYAGGCARNIACESNAFPKRESLTATGRLDNMGNATAFDVYLCMFDIIDLYASNKEASGKPLSEKEIIDLMEKACETAFVDFKKKDFEFEWKNS